MPRSPREVAHSAYLSGAGELRWLGQFRGGAGSEITLSQLAPLEIGFSSVQSVAALPRFASSFSDPFVPFGFSPSPSPAR